MATLAKKKPRRVVLTLGARSCLLTPCAYVRGSHSCVARYPWP